MEIYQYYYYIQSNEYDNDITKYLGQSARISFHIKKLTNIINPIEKHVKINFKWYGKDIETSYGINVNSEIIFDFHYIIKFLITEEIIKYLESEYIEMNICEVEI